jgi:D-glycero-D-manno-heptose 1,7-bisphosphate phosphatase
MATRGAVFLDRDETLNQDSGYIVNCDDFAWMPGAPAALKRFHDAGLPIFVVTNQGGIGRGFFTEADMHRFNAHLAAAAAGGPITDIAFCPHHPLAPDPAMAGPCRCRKPEPGLLLGLAEKWRIDPSRSVMIGDRDSDVEAGRRAGMCSYLFDKTNLDHLARQIIDRHFADHLTRPA